MSLNNRQLLLQDKQDKMLEYKKWRVDLHQIRRQTDRCRQWSYSPREWEKDRTKKVTQKKERKFLITSKQNNGFLILVPG